MKIAVIDVSAENAGALSVLKDLYDFLVKSERAKGHEWYFFTCDDFIKDTYNIRQIINSNIKKTRMHRLIWDNFTFLKYDKEYNFDLVLSLQNAAVNCNNKRQIVYFHNVLLLEDRRKYSLFKRNERAFAMYTHFLSLYTKISLKRASTVIVQTNTVKEKLKKKYGIKGDIAVVNPNISNIDISAKIRNDHIKGFIYPANPSAFKNHKLIVAASKILNDKFPDFKVLFTFKEDNAVKEIVREAEGTKQIVFTGYLPREKILELYNDYALIWASSMESYPIPFAEAMALKDIIIAPDEDYALEILKSYNNAIFYNKNDAGALAEAMNTALKLNQNAANVSELRVEYNTWNDVLDLMVMH